jgi:adenylate cyclase
VSVLFLDVCNFTSFAEETEPQEVVRELNELFEAAVPCIHENGGHVDKFVGDGLIAVFGAPERLPDHAARAVEAAQCVVEKVNGREGEGLRVGVGVNTGRVIAGTVGGGGRVDFTVIGDPVNTAARVEHLTRETDTDLLITGATRAALDGKADGWRELPEMELEGKRDPVQVFAPGDG